MLLARDLSSSDVYARQDIELEGDETGVSLGNGFFS
jgi:hypothetical protein